MEISTYPSESTCLVYWQIELSCFGNLQLELLALTSVEDAGTRLRPRNAYRPSRTH